MMFQALLSEKYDNRAQKADRKIFAPPNPRIVGSPLNIWLV